VSPQVLSFIANCSRWTRWWKRFLTGVKINDNYLTIFQFTKHTKSTKAFAKAFDDSSDGSLTILTSSAW